MKCKGRKGRRTKGSEKEMGREIFFLVLGRKRRGKHERKNTKETSIKKKKTDKEKKEGKQIYREKKENRKRKYIDR